LGEKDIKKELIDDIFNNIEQFMQCAPQTTELGEITQK